MSQCLWVGNLWISISTTAFRTWFYYTLISLLWTHNIVWQVSYVISELFVKYQFGATHTTNITDSIVTNRGLCSAESKIFHRLSSPHLHAVSTYNVCCYFRCVQHQEKLSVYCWTCKSCICHGCALWGGKVCVCQESILDILGFLCPLYKLSSL